MKTYCVLFVCLISGLIASAQSPREFNQLSNMIDTVSSPSNLLVIPIVDSTTGLPFDDDKYAVFFSVCNAADSSVIVTSDMILPEGYAVRFKSTEAHYLVEVNVEKTTEQPDSRVIARYPPYWVKLDMSKYNLKERQVLVAPISVPTPTSQK